MYDEYWKRVKMLHCPHASAPGEWTLVLPGASSVSYFQIYYCKAGYGSDIHVWSTWSRCLINMIKWISIPWAAFEVYYWDVNIIQPVIQLLDSCSQPKWNLDHLNVQNNSSSVHIIRKEKLRGITSLSRVETIPGSRRQCQNAHQVLS